MANLAHLLATLAAMTLASLPLATAGRNCRGPDAPPAPTTWIWSQYPNPNSPNQDQQLQCCRSNQSYVCDPNGLMSERQADEIDQAVKNMFVQTRCSCCRAGTGYVVRVALMQQMVRIDSRHNSTMDRLRDAHLYAYQIAHRWGMETDCGQGLLILYSRDDNILFTLTFRKTRSHLPDYKVGDVSLRVRHHFNDEETIADGIKEMIARYKRILNMNRNG